MGEISPLCSRHLLGRETGSSAGASLKLSGALTGTPHQRTVTLIPAKRVLPGMG